MSDRVRWQEAFKLALSLTLFYWLSLWMDWDMPKFGAIAIVVTSLSTSGASFNKGLTRVLGTGLGALAGFVLLSWFSQSPAGMLAAVALYLVFVGYFLQITRQADTWFNAGFLAVAVWSSSYMKVDTAFHFATTRFLETAAGVLLFTLVSALLWPRTSRAALVQQGQALQEGVLELFRLYRGQLTGARADTAAALRTRLAGDYQQFTATLQAARYDTATVHTKKRVWDALRIDLREFGNAQELWRESIHDCRQLDLRAALPHIEATLDTLERRLAYAGRLWRCLGSEENCVPPDETLPGAIVVEPEPGGAGLSHSERAALVGFAARLVEMDRVSRALLCDLLVLAEVDAPVAAPPPHARPDPFRPSAWSPERLLKALFPALCWVAGYTFWICVDPPGGPAVPMISTAFGLMMIMAPVNLFALLLVLLLSMFIAVAPVYLLVMPQLDSGFALLSLVFVYAFVFAWLGGKAPILKLGPLAMFVMMVDINNDQVYSFLLLVNAGLLMLLGVGIVTLVHWLLSPMHPEKVLLRSVQRFLRGGAQIVSGYRLQSQRRMAGSRRRRRRLFESAILPVANRLPAVVKSLDYAAFPDNTPEKVDQLVDSLQSIRLRLQGLDATWERAAQESPELMQALAPLNEKWRRRLRERFEQWSRPEAAGAMPGDVDAGAELAQDLALRLDRLRQEAGAGRYDDRALRNLYAVMGGTRSLLDALHQLGHSMRRINWAQWAEARF